nr:ATP-grasp domain-containing protein [Cohnella massiliensis]
MDTRPDECAAQQIVKKIIKVPYCQEADYYDKLEEICRVEKVNCLVPLYEPELMGLAGLRSRFEEIGVRILIATKETILTCVDKYSLYQFFKLNDFSTPDTFEEPTNLDDKSLWVIKPKIGMGSRDVYITTYKEVSLWYERVPNPIVQRYIEGQEISIDVFVSDKRQVLSIVPRVRLEVRAGEVSKSITIEDKEITLLTIQLVNKLKLTGPATIQGIRETNSGRFYFIEVNPRFGGGVPLTIEAGIPYAEFIKASYTQKPGVLHSYQPGLKMLRYDEAVYVKGGF